MIAKYIRIIMLITGVLTMTAGVIYFAPDLGLRLQGVSVTEATGRFFARHWGLSTMAVGALLVYASSRAALRAPALTLATVTKGTFVALLLTQWNDPALAGLRGAFGFDVVCVVLFVAYLLGRRPSAPA